MCPHRRTFVLEHGLIGDDANGNLYVSCPLHKRNFSLESGECYSDDEYRVLAFDVKAEGEDLLIHLPEEEDLDAVLGTAKWMVKQAKSEAEGLNPRTQVEVVGPEGDGTAESTGGNCSTAGAGSGCATEGGAGGKLSW